MPLPQLLISLATEGTTDNRFLEFIVQKTFTEVVNSSLQCELDIMGAIDGMILPKTQGTIQQKMLTYAKLASDRGASILCFHIDADSPTDNLAFQNSVIPGFNAVNNSPAIDICKNLVAIVPIYMTEAWLLADTNLLINEIGAVQTAQQLGINANPESFNDPKTLIEDAIRAANQNRRKRLRPNVLSERGKLYEIIGEKINVSELRKLFSYSKFESGVLNALHNLGYY